MTTTHPTHYAKLARAPSGNFFQKITGKAVTMMKVCLKGIFFLKVGELRNTKLTPLMRPLWSDILSLLSGLRNTYTTPITYAQWRSSVKREEGRFRKSGSGNEPKN